MPSRIQLRRTAGWRKPEGAIVVARPSKWGNPFRIYRDHHLVGPMWHVACETWTHIPATQCIHGYVSSSRAISISEAVDLYRTLLKIRQRDEPDRLRQWLHPLRGHDLACWCPLDQPCHADVLLQICREPV